MALAPNSISTPPGAPAYSYFPIVPNDATPLKYTTRSIYVGGAGNVVVKDYEGNTVTFTAVPAGSILPIRSDYVMAASTATNMVGLA